VRLDDELLTERDPGRLFSGASLIKTPLAALVTEDVAAGRRAWDDPVAIDIQMRAPGDGLLRGLELPRAVALDEALMLMIAVSDNTATNAFVALLGGLDRVNERLREAGWSSRIRRWIGGRHAVDDDLPADPSLPSAAGASRICVCDHQDALARVLTLDARASRAFEAQQDRRALARELSVDSRFAHKTATVDRVRHDAGVLLGEHGELWVACLTDGGPPREHVDHPACVAMGAAMADTLRALGLERLLA
jgi:beta-lactamase class A